MNCNVRPILYHSALGQRLNQGFLIRKGDTHIAALLAVFEADFEAYYFFATWPRPNISPLFTENMHHELAVITIISHSPDLRETDA
jgi:hypothetical protein